MQKYATLQQCSFVNILTTLLLSILGPLSEDQLVQIKNMNFSFNLYSPSVLSNEFMADCIQ